MCLFYSYHLHKTAVKCIYLSRACGLTEWPFNDLGTGSIVSSSSSVQQPSAKGRDGCLQDHPSLLCDSLSFTLPGALHVLEALIGPELDCGGPDYWCQRVLGHVGTLELLVPGELAAEGEGGSLCSLESHLSVLVTQSVNTTCPHMLQCALKRHTNNIQCL